MKVLVAVLTLAQAILAVRVIARLLRTGRGTRVGRAPASWTSDETVSVIVPVLNEIDRLGPCLVGLIAQGQEVAEILVVDGGSTDGTQALADGYAQCNQRIRLIDAAPVPPGRNGKAHGLHVGYGAIAVPSQWVLTIDADVRPDPQLVRSLLAHAAAKGVPALSAATLQVLSGRAEAVVHPAMLTSLVYRYGIPGTATARVNHVQANGQCFLARRTVIEAAGGFLSVMDSVCEDVTLARSIASSGYPVGFYETDHLVRVDMYRGWRDAWDNWSRSLPMRDRFTRRASAVGLAEVLLVQALPLWLAPLLARACGHRHPTTMLNAALLCTRVGTLMGMARAYEAAPWTYWISPVADLPVAVLLWSKWPRRRHVWRGRAFTTGGLVSCG